MSNVTAPVRLGNDSAAALHAKRSLNGGNVFGIDTLKGGDSGPIDNTMFGPGAAAATILMKQRLGYPAKDVGPGYGMYLDAYLHGQKKLPASYQARRVAVAAKAHLSSHQQRLLAIEQGQVGYVEGANNANKYSTADGRGAEAWCADFQTWACTQAGLSFNFSYVPAVVAAARAGQLGLRCIGLERFAFACYDWEHDGTADHIGLVVAILGGGQFYAIEGNTSALDYSNGGMVRKVLRNTSQVQQFVGLHGLV